MYLYDKDDKLCVASDNEIRLWDFFDHREEAPELISIELASIKIQKVFVNKNSKEFQGIFTSDGDYIYYTGRLQKIFEGKIESGTVTCAEFAFDEQAIFIGTSKGQIIKLNIKTGEPEGMPINVSADELPVTSIFRFKGLKDENVFLVLANSKELYVYAETRNDCTLVDFGAEEASD